MANIQIQRSLKEDQLIFKIATAVSEFNEVYKLSWQVYSEEGYINPMDYPDYRLQDQYEKYSVYFLARNNERVIGAVRLIIDSPKLYVEEDFNLGISVDKKRIAEISRLVVLKEYRRKNPRLFLELIRMAFNFSEDRNLTHWISVMSKGLKKLFSRFGVEFRLIPTKPLLPEHLEIRKKLPGYYQREIFPYIISLKEVKKGFEKLNDSDNEKKGVNEG